MFKYFLLAILIPCFIFESFKYFKNKNKVSPEIAMLSLRGIKISLASIALISLV